MTIVQRRDKNKYNNGSKTSFNDYKNDHIKPKLIPTANCYQKEQYINKKKEMILNQGKYRPSKAHRPYAPFNDEYLRNRFAVGSIHYSSNDGETTAADRQTIVASKLGKLSQKEIVNDRFLITSYALIPSTNEPVKAVEDRQFYDHNYKSENGPISDGYKLENTL